MSDHAPRPVSICGECGRVAGKIDGRWWHLADRKERWVGVPPEFSMVYEVAAEAAFDDVKKVDLGWGEAYPDEQDRFLRGTRPVVDAVLRALGVLE